MNKRKATTAELTGKVETSGYAPGYRDFSFVLVDSNGKETRVILDAKDSLLVAKEIIEAHSVAWTDRKPLDLLSGELKPQLGAAFIEDVSNLIKYSTEAHTMSAELEKMQTEIDAITEQIKTDVSGLCWDGDVKPIYQRALALVDSLNLAELDNAQTCAYRVLLVAASKLPEFYSAAIVKVPLKLIH